MPTPATTVKRSPADGIATEIGSVLRAIGPPLTFVSFFALASL